MVVALEGCSASWHSEVTHIHLHPGFHYPAAKAEAAVQQAVHVDRRVCVL